MRYEGMVYRPGVQPERPQGGAFGCSADRKTSQMPGKDSKIRGVELRLYSWGIPGAGNEAP